MVLTVAGWLLFAGFISALALMVWIVLFEPPPDDEGQVEE